MAQVEATKLQADSKSHHLRWLTTALIVWCGLTAGVAVHAYLYPWSHTVFDVYGPASRNWWAGENLYLHRNDYFRYSPLFAVAITPFAILPDSWGNAAWKIFNC